MSPKVIRVKPRSDFTLEILFANLETRIFDVKPYLDKGIFRDLQKKNEFASVEVEAGSISWAGGQDFSPETLYFEGRQVT